MMLFHIYFLQELKEQGEGFHKYLLWSSVGFYSEIDLWLFFQNFNSTDMGECVELAGHYYKKFIAMPTYSDRLPSNHYNLEVGQVDEEPPF